MFTVSDVAAAFRVSKQTARGWAKEFQQHLSPAANPPEGKTRHFDEDDMRAFALVAELREQGSGYEDIHAALAVGQRGELPIPGQAETDQEQSPAGAALAPIALFEQFAARIDQQYRGQIEAIENERDNLRETLQGERQERIEAEKRATAAETELRLIKERASQEKDRTAVQAAQAEPRPGLLDRLFGR